MQNVSDIPQSPRWNTIPTQSHRPPSKKKEERTTRFQSPVATDERTDGQTRRDAAPLLARRRRATLAAALAASLTATLGRRLLDGSLVGPVGLPRPLALLPLVA